MATQSTSDGTLRIVLIVLGVLILLPVLMMAFAVPMMGMMGWGWTGGTPGGFSPLWGVVMGLFWLVVIAVVGYLIYRAASGGLGGAGSADPALEELRLAYARGDITDEEFEQRRETLRGGE